MGTAIFADDIIILRHGRSSMKQMLKVCEDYAKEHNLQFSVDPNPTKYKSKAIYMCGTSNNGTYPDNLPLDDHVLPWVKQADHLCHVLSQDCNMEANARVMRAK